MKPRLLIGMPVPDKVAERARLMCEVIFYPDRPLEPREVVARAEDLDPDAILVNSRMRMSAELIDALPPSVRILATYSVGDEHIDRAAAAGRGIAVVTTPDVVTDATADLTMLLLLGACRRAAEYVSIMRAGWGRSLGIDEMLGMHVGGRRLGIVGMGRIGRAVARRARAHGMTILYHSRRRLGPDLEDGARYFKNLADMLPLTQVLTLHAPGGTQTNTLIDRKAIGRLPRGAVLLNAARGQLVDEDALVEALRSGRLAAAGLDVFRNEPDIDPRFFQLENVFLTPHVGSATRETREAMGMTALEGTLLAWSSI